MINIVVLIAGIIAYLIGSIPTGYSIARLKGVADIRNHGSGNIGATNVARILGVHYFVLIFLLDAGKAYAYLSIIWRYFPLSYLYFFAVLLLFGNMFSLFLYGRGGKGVATLCGLLCALNSTALMVFIISWLCTMLFLKTVGIASVSGAVAVIVYAFLQHNYDFLLFSCIAGTAIIWSHKTNIKKWYTLHCINTKAKERL